MTAVLDLTNDLSPDLLRAVRAWSRSSAGRDRYPDPVLDAVRALTGMDPMPMLAPARKAARAELRTTRWDRVTNHRDPTGNLAVRRRVTWQAWRRALAENLPETVPARALDNLATLCAA